MTKYEHYDCQVFIRAAFKHLNGMTDDIFDDFKVEAENQATKRAFFKEMYTELGI